MGRFLSLRRMVAGGLAAAVVAVIAVWASGIRRSARPGRHAADGGRVAQGVLGEARAARAVHVHDRKAARRRPMAEPVDSRGRRPPRTDHDVHRQRDVLCDPVRRQSPAADDRFTLEPRDSGVRSRRRPAPRDTCARRARALRPARERKRAVDQPLGERDLPDYAARWRGRDPARRPSRIQQRARGGVRAGLDPGASPRRRGSDRARAAYGRRFDGHRSRNGGAAATASMCDVQQGCGRHAG